MCGPDSIIPSCVEGVGGYGCEPVRSRPSGNGLFRDQDSPEIRAYCPGAEFRDELASRAYGADARFDPFCGWGTTSAMMKWA
jgi:hypothetical protein